MTPEQQIKALAELDGYSPFYCDLSRLWSWKTKDGRYRNFNQGVSEEHLVRITNYLASYDAIIPLLTKCWKCGMFKPESFYKGLKNYYPTGLLLLTEATPSQLCEALLRATGKWKE